MVKILVKHTMTFAELYFVKSIGFTKSCDYYLKRVPITLF